MNKVAAFALWRKNSILSMSEKMFCPPQPLRFWITPACAGKRRSDWIIRSIYWDHPRVCGEKDKAAEKAQHLRGKGSETQRRAIRAGITPACAGKSCSRRPRWTHTGDHPRVCGEKALKSWLMSGDVGSPLRVRGKALHFNPHRTGFGITPACAGKRDVDTSHADLQQDHPRMCGEKSVSAEDAHDVAGSPPRVRGKVLW